jgi:hypothetical protein
MLCLFTKIEKADEVMQEFIASDRRTVTKLYELDEYKACNNPPQAVLSMDRDTAGLRCYADQLGLSDALFLTERDVQKQAKLLVESDEEETDFSDDIAISDSTDSEDTAVDVGERIDMPALENVTLYAKGAKETGKTQECDGGTMFVDIHHDVMFHGREELESGIAGEGVDAPTYNYLTTWLSGKLKHEENVFHLQPSWAQKYSRAVIVTLHAVTNACTEKANREAYESVYVTKILDGKPEELKTILLKEVPAFSTMSDEMQDDMIRRALPELEKVFAAHGRPRSEQDLRE